MDIFVGLLEFIVSAIGLWIAIKGKKHVVETFKAIVQTMVDLQIISKAKVQEITDSLSLTYSNWSTKTKNNRFVILGFVYGIIASFLVFSLIALIRYIKVNGMEEILNSLQFPYNKEPTQPSLYGGMNVISLFWMYVLLFSVIGAIRGWAKELLVAFGVITAVAANLLLEKYIPLVRDLDKTSSSVFWIRTIILVALVFFGYQTVSIARSAFKGARERLQDVLFGGVFGGLNGYLIAGTMLFYNHVANYPYKNIISPATDPAFLNVINKMMTYMPPSFLGEPGIYFAIIIMLIFVIVVYI